MLKWQMPLNDWNVITKQQQHINPWYAWSSHPFFFLLHVFSRLLLPSSHGIHLPPFLVTAFCITNRISKEKKKEKRQHKHNKMYSAKNMSFTFKDKCILFKLSKMKTVYLWNKVQQLHCISLFWGGIHLHIPLHRKRLVYIEQELDIL